MHEPWHAEYRTMSESVGIVDLTGRTNIEVAGPDRAKFLHNLCTQEIKKLPPGHGAEALLLDARGHVLFHVLIFNRGESLILETVSGVGEKLLAHLNRYLIREQVELRDRTSDWATWMVAGPQAKELIEKFAGITIPSAALGCADGTISSVPMQLRLVPFTPWPSYELVVEREQSAHLQAELIAAGGTICGATTLEAARIEAGWPNAGVDITDKNLPQELGRDPQAISFTKGCYIGQETVARIDALGHVNKYLVRLKFAGRDVPAAGIELHAAGQSVGSITSATYSPKLDATIALGFVRRGLHTPGQTLESATGPCLVWA